MLLSFVMNAMQDVNNNNNKFSNINYSGRRLYQYNEDDFRIQFDVSRL